jgi:hypothetical protein
LHGRGYCARKRTVQIDIFSYRGGVILIRSPPVLPCKHQHKQNEWKYFYPSG